MQLEQEQTDFESPRPRQTQTLGAGAMALWFGFTKAETARRFALAMGALYGVLGFLGFIFGASGLPAAGPIHQERFLWRPEPTTLELGTLDHTLHLVFAGIFILGALLRFKRYPKI